jgi:hypothetical protein
VTGGRLEGLAAWAHVVYRLARGWRARLHGKALPL